MPSSRPVSSMDVGYQSGFLSVYPSAIDNKVTLYEAKNNATSTLRQSLPYNSTQIILDDGSSFPANGIVRIGPQEGLPGKIVVPDNGQLIIGTNEVQIGNAELVYYGLRNGNILTNLYRGFAGSQQRTWNAGDYVIGGVNADYHNAIKDAILNIENNLGTNQFPTAASLNGILQELERRFLSPKPVFRAFPRIGAPPLKVRFQNYSGGDPLRYLWDFGDGTTSTDISPIHTYNEEGVFSVKLNIITSLGSQGIANKSNYITVSEEQGVAFFYAEEINGNSIQTSGDNATEFTFVDQSEGAIVERIWNFDDTTRITVSDPNIHTITHQYVDPGIYNPTLLVIFNNQQLKTVFLSDEIQVN